MGQGKNTRTSVSRPSRGALRLCVRVCHANQPKIASNENSRAGLISAITAQQTPRPIQAHNVGFCRILRASAIAPIREQAEKLVSQKISGIKSSGAETAHTAPATV